MKTSQLLAILVLLVTITSCSVSKSARTQRNIISGTWILDNIDYENNEGAFSSVIFGDAKDLCFEGSNWYFRDNNSTGRYTIKQGSLCQGGDRFIRWSVVEPADRVSQLQFKFIDEKRKDVSGGFGYRLDIANLTETEMTLKSNVSVDGEPIIIVYEFTKQQ
ncbi:lipocalin family protein [Croceivirga thetidis]|uniref:Lipocalin family protein n=1 Tax=Croceivirga thetidis TaxID=2721623 RepID=A0ABX1GR27_9FLAO|nr:lipocalin family protein [Croceivirga thetidis]NKI32371.1 lipocalin family protein [Croceivirga thetidis]